MVSAVRVSVQAPLVLRLWCLRHRGARFAVVVGPSLWKGVLWSRSQRWAGMWQAGKVQVGRRGGVGVGGGGGHVAGGEGGGGVGGGGEGGGGGVGGVGAGGGVDGGAV